jgi:hypothetical protein
MEGRTLADWPTDVEALADALQISRFAVVGVSAGGPYAAACAALIPDCLYGVALVSSRALAQYNWAERPGVEEGWSPELRAEFELAQKDPTAGANLAAEHFADEVGPLEAYPETIRKALEVAEGDRWFFQDASRAAIFDAYIRETWRQGLDAVKWELIDVFLPWGFRLSDIAIPVNIWHGPKILGSSKNTSTSRRAPFKKILSAFGLIAVIWDSSSIGRRSSKRSCDRSERSWSRVGPQMGCSGSGVPVPLKTGDGVGGFQGFAVPGRPTRFRATDPRHLSGSSRDGGTA